MPKGQVVLDLETKNSFDDIGGRNPAELGVSLVGTYFYATGGYKAFEEADFGELERHLSEATRVIGFNIRRFDFPALQPYFKRLDLSQVKVLDLLEELEKVLGHRVSLQSVSKATLNEGKSGSGLDAIEFFRKGEMEKLKKYCLDDVRLTREIYERGKRLGELYYSSKDGTARLTAKVDWKDPEPELNLSLF